MLKILRTLAVCVAISLCAGTSQASPPGKPGQWHALSAHYGCLFDSSENANTLSLDYMYFAYGPPDVLSAGAGPAMIIHDGHVVGLLAEIPLRAALHSPGGGFGVYVVPALGSAHREFASALSFGISYTMLVVDFEFGTQLALPRFDEPSWVMGTNFSLRISIPLCGNIDERQFDLFCP